MKSFHQWLLDESGQAAIPTGVLQGYEQALKQQVRQVIARTQDSQLRSRFKEMLTCPIRDSRGHCRSFTDYVVATLYRNGIHQRFDLEQALAYIFEKMLMDKSDTGEPRRTVFGAFDEKPGLVEGNPLQARFLKFLQFAVGNIRKGKIPRLGSVYRPAGTVSIGQGRHRDGDEADGVSPDDLPAHSSLDQGLAEMIEDISTLLQRKEREAGLPLVKMFQKMVEGEKTEQQRHIYGYQAARRGRAIILQTMEDYARSTGNHFLLRQVEILKDRNPNEPLPARRKPEKSAAPKWRPGKEADFASIVSVLDRLGRPAGSSDLMRYRRRWVEFAPRSAEGGYKNRLEEVLDLAVKEGVLLAIKRPSGAVVYEPGPNANRYRPDSKTSAAS